MNFITNIPGLKEVLVSKVEQVEDTVRIYLEVERRLHKCPQCGNQTARIHDYHGGNLRFLFFHYCSPN